MSVKMNQSDPAYWMLDNVPRSTTTVHDDDCYICNDDEFARMGLPLCYPCPVCGGHIAADDEVCSLGHNAREHADMRARVIRAVVAAQWAVACVIADEVADEDADSAPGNRANRIGDDVADLPTAEQIVDGVA